MSRALMDEAEKLYREYLDKVTELEASRKPGDGLFGIGKSPADDPCHDRFSEELERLLRRFAALSPGSEEVSRMLAFIYRMPAEHREPASAYWMLNAVQGFTVQLIDMLSPKDAEKLLNYYVEAYPRVMRLPVQKKVYSALKKASKNM